MQLLRVGKRRGDSRTAVSARIHLLHRTMDRTMAEDNMSVKRVSLPLHGVYGTREDRYRGMALQAESVAAIFLGSVSRGARLRPTMAGTMATGCVNVLRVLWWCP